jgi:hypothetical protein
MIVYHEFPPQSPEDVSFNHQARQEYLDKNADCDYLRALGYLAGTALLPNVQHPDKRSFAKELAIGMLLKDYDLDPELLACYKEGVEDGVEEESNNSAVIVVMDNDH